MDSEGRQVSGSPPPPAGKHGRNGSLSGNVDAFEFNRASTEPRPTPKKIPGFELLQQGMSKTGSPRVEAAGGPGRAPAPPPPPSPPQAPAMGVAAPPEVEGAPSSLPQAPVVPAAQAVRRKADETPVSLSQNPEVQSERGAAESRVEEAPGSHAPTVAVQSEPEGGQPKTAPVAAPAPEKLESDAPAPILDGSSSVATGSGEGKIEEVVDRSHGIEVTADNKEAGSKAVDKEVPASTSSTPASKPGLAAPTSAKKWRAPSDADLKAMLVIPEYLARDMEVAVETKGAAVPEGAPPGERIEAPKCPILVFINSKSGGRLGPELKQHFEDLISSYQVYDLASHSPSAVLQYGLGCLHRMAKSRKDECAQKTLERLRILVAGGDGTVGWVLSSVGALRDLPEPISVPPVGVIPLGTGNDLSRSFGWGGEFSSTSKSTLKRVLWKALNANHAHLDAWKAIVIPAKSVAAGDIKFPHAMHPQHHVPLPSSVAGEEHVKDERDPAFEGLFFNYFSVGMDAQVAYGFHHLRDEKPWLARGRAANQMIYSTFGCTQGWFCTACSVAPRARGVSNILKLWVRKRGSKDWEDIHLPSNIRAVVICNLKSYAGGRNPWGKPSSGRREKEGYEEQRCDDGLLEVMGLKDGWHSAFVLLEVSTAVRLCQAEAIKLELNGNSRKHAYLQMDGEPWMQPMGAPDDETNTIVMIKKLPDPSLLLKR